MLTIAFLSLGLCQLAFAGFYRWEITWVANAAPDGFNRPIIGVNGKWPPPVLQAEVGERVTVVVCNKLGNQTTSLHWHGIRQFQSNVGILSTQEILFWLICLPDYGRDQRSDAMSHST
jgi:hypothetical protein